MVLANHVQRQCVASSSRLTLLHPLPPTYLPSRHFSLFPQERQNTPVAPFFTPPNFPPPKPWAPYPLGRGHKTGSGGDGKGKSPEHKEEEVDDHEWEIRAARAMLHLRESIPRFFHPEQTSSDMLPADVFSRDVMLKLPHPLPLKISSLSAYQMAYTIARNGMQALHTDLSTSLDRMTFSHIINDPVGSPTSALLLATKSPSNHRQRQLRALITVHGTPRLPSHQEAIWHTSSLYTISPRSGLIISHQVESIRPLPGEGVADWLKNRLRGWTAKDHSPEPEPVPCPRTVPVPSEAELLRFLRNKRRE